MGAGAGKHHRNCNRSGTRFVAASVLVSASLFLSACTVTDSEFVDASVASATCRSGLGSYSLSRTVLRISVVDIKDADTKETNREFEGPKPETGSDPRHIYCLDYLASPTSDDSVKVMKTQSGLLTSISTDILDQSRFIAIELIEALFTLFAGLPAGDVRSGTAGTTAGKVNRFRYEFDPFDFADTATMNSRLSELGFCFIMPDYSFDPALAGINEYCNNPWATVQKAGPAWARLLNQDWDYEPGFLPTTPTAPVVKDKKLLNGVLYRPKVPYTVLVMRRDRTEGWALHERKTVHMENISPILSVGVKRALFARRVTVLLFQNGVLENVCVYKGSELVEAVKIPFTVASAIVKLPAAILQIKINTTDDLAALAAEEEKLAELQAAYIAAAAAKDFSKLPGAGSAPGKTNENPAKTAETAFKTIFDSEVIKSNDPLTRDDTGDKTLFTESSNDFFGCPEVKPESDPISVTGFDEAKTKGGM